jgi:capsular polysaccharide synthesis protein/polysaccharide pyruvyl transferase
MNRVIWTCWLQGRDRAPRLVQRCLSSWERKNPGWQVRCLDQRLVRRYLDLPDLRGKVITHASFSDVIRILLLREYGGVWVDATLYCHRPLDQWLESCLAERFFAFRQPAADRLLSSWFLAAGLDDPLVSAWCEKTLTYWSQRTRAESYFWFHDLFAELYQSDRRFKEAWDRVPRILAAGPHAIQRVGMFRAEDEAAAAIDWTTPVFKLTHRIEGGSYAPGTLVWRLLESDPSFDSGHRPGGHNGTGAPRPASSNPGPATFACLKVSTENLGDHIQILAGRMLMRRLGIEPSLYLDRDHELASSEALHRTPGRIAVLLNGWFKTNGTQWPPHEKVLPVFLGFHIRLFQCPELLSDQAIAYYRKHQPIGCRDAYTRELLRSKEVEAFESNCLSLAFPRRPPRPATQTKVFVASRDTRLLDLLPGEVGPFHYVNHYSGSTDFHGNLARAETLLQAYRTEARLIITTFLHCALPALAMGIPVVVFYPLNDARGHQSDRERFGALANLTRVYRTDEMDQVDWDPAPVDVGGLKLSLADQLAALAARWPLPDGEPLSPIAPAGELPPP